MNRPPWSPPPPNGSTDWNGHGTELNETVTDVEKKEDKVHQSFFLSFSFIVATVIREGVQWNVHSECNGVSLEVWVKLRLEFCGIWSLFCLGSVKSLTKSEPVNDQQMWGYLTLEVGKWNSRSLKQNTDQQMAGQGGRSARPNSRRLWPDA